MKTDKIDKDLLCKSALFGDIEISQTIDFLGKKVELYLLSAEEMITVYKISTEQAADLFLRGMLVNKEILSKSISSINGEPFGGYTNKQLIDMNEVDKNNVYAVRLKILNKELLEVLDQLMQEYISFRDFYLFVLYERIKSLNEDKDVMPPFSENGSSLNSSEEAVIG